MCVYLFSHRFDDGYCKAVMKHQRKKERSLTQLNNPTTKQNYYLLFFFKLRMMHLPSPATYNLFSPFIDVLFGEFINLRYQF